MNIRKFDPAADFTRLETWLRGRYQECGKPVFWLPERLHDLLYRVDGQEAAEGGTRSRDYIFLAEEDSRILGCILPDGENVYFGLTTGRDALFPALLSFSEEHCLPLFSPGADGSIKFWAAVSDSLEHAKQHLAGLGYQKYAEEEYTCSLAPGSASLPPQLPQGFRLVFGEDYPDERNKWTALRLGFHPDWEETDPRVDMGPYEARKQSSMYPDSFECLILDEGVREGNPVCAYCFVYVDSRSGTAMIEPLSVREAWQGRGLGTALIRGAVLRCRELGLGKCYVDCFGWRKDFYTAAGFTVEDRIGFWYRCLG